MQCVVKIPLEHFSKDYRSKRLKSGIFSTTTQYVMISCRVVGIQTFLRYMQPCESNRYEK